MFQFNNPAWRRDVSAVFGRRHTGAAWECSPQEEVEYPIRFYAARFREVVAAGGQPLDAVRGMRLQHHGPGIYGPFLRTGRTAGFAEAWRRVPDAHRNPIHRSLIKWGFAAD